MAKSLQGDDLFYETCSRLQQSQDDLNKARNQMSTARLKCPHCDGMVEVFEDEDGYKLEKA